MIQKSFQANFRAHFRKLCYEMFSLFVINGHQLNQQHKSQVTDEMIVKQKKKLHESKQKNNSMSFKCFINFYIYLCICEYIKTSEWLINLRLFSTSSPH